ncbi:ferritin-like domain-containing protein [Christiangramia sabulilitoris]|uniref:Ferritin-like domain-containing protein n=1 Tax=Christiangramia sabulilitoris TaxID=2583991 RepID=A0A550HX61_9FLAO|nr:ferritin-like domain-containing protein [Christiangramia sabulilitoris]TRO63276.1 ferritin-like domain-containing protein [Christiangramia sabulilitoris]
MNFIDLLDKISGKEALEEKSSRRESFQKIKRIGKQAALASIPFALAATGKKTSAATMAMPAASAMASPTDILNFALTLEYLERNFYQIGLDTTGLIPEKDKDVFALILDHEKSHVNFLAAALGGLADPEPTFDFTVGGALDTFTDYGTFLLLSQGFEDTGVRAYKGQAGALAIDNTLLEYALQIHSVEARHASQVRRMRGEKGWITGNGSVGTAIAAVYEGEANTVQGGVELKGLFDDFGGTAAITEAFDEPLSMAEVNAIAGLFIV